MGFFWSLYLLDHGLATSAPGASGAVQRYLDFDPDRIADAVSGLAGMLAAVFGIVVTVVSIVVQLAANRFTGVVRLFLRDRVHLGVMAYYVVACIYGVWLSVSLQPDYVPRVALVVMLLATTVGLVLLAPYFGYVFEFLEPGNLIRHIQRDASRAVEKALTTDVDDELEESQTRVVATLEELTDIANRSLLVKDKMVASAAVDALHGMVLSYWAMFAREQPGARRAAWLHGGKAMSDNPSIVALDPYARKKLQDEGFWFEWKVLRQYLTIFNEALSTHSELANLIAINTRHLSEVAAGEPRPGLLTLLMRFMNSYMRAALNQRDVRTAYHVLNQYRLYVESLMSEEHSQLVGRGVRYMAYYGQVALDAGLPFVTETVAYDLAGLGEHAARLQWPETPELVASLIALGEGESHGDARLKRTTGALPLGVCKAQLKLVLSLQVLGATEWAEPLIERLQLEAQRTLKTVQRELDEATDEVFWEITDRGRHLDFLAPAERKLLSPLISQLLGGRR